MVEVEVPEGELEAGTIDVVAADPASRGEPHEPVAKGLDIEAAESFDLLGPVAGGRGSRPSPPVRSLPALRYVPASNACS